MAKLMPLMFVTVLLSLANACSDGESSRPADGPTVEVAGDDIAIPQSAIDVLADGYAFTADLDIDGPEEDLTVRFDGVQVGDSVQGLVMLGGSYGAAIDEWRAAEMEVVTIGERAWWREPGGEWQPGFEPGGDSQDPLLTLSYYATPWFYLDALRFDSLTLPLNGSPEDVNGVEALPVRLDKQAVVDVMEQGSEFKRYPDPWDEHGPVFPGVGENALQVLPSDFQLDVWFAEQGGYPVRILFTYSVGEDDYCTLCWGFERGMNLRLQMDITDPGAEIEIEPPIPIPTEVPTPTTPPGELSGIERARIAEIAATDPRVEAIRQGKLSGAAIAHESWHTSDLEVLGGYTYVTFNEPLSFTGSLPSIIYDETETRNPPFTEIETDVQLDGIERLRVLVYLPEERVVQIEVVEPE